MLASGQVTVGDLVKHLLTLPQDAPVAIGTEDYFAASTLERLPELEHTLSEDGNPIIFKNEDSNFEEFCVVVRTNYSLDQLLDIYGQDLYDMGIHERHVYLIETVVF